MTLHRFTWDSTENPRACQLCDYGKRNGVPIPECQHPENREGFVVGTCRAPGGFCGPDAKHLTFPGLRAPLTPSELQP